MQEQFGDRVTFIGMPGRAELGEIQDFIAARGVDAFQHVVDDASLWRDFGIRSQPSFAFINDDGTLEIHSGGLGMDGLTDRVQALLNR